MKNLNQLFEEVLKESQVKIHVSDPEFSVMDFRKLNRNKNWKVHRDHCSAVFQGNAEDFAKDLIASVNYTGYKRGEWEYEGYSEGLESKEEDIVEMINELDFGDQRYLETNDETGGNIIVLKLRPDENSNKYWGKGVR